MADQTQRLEVATVKAEQASDIMYQFANNDVGQAAIPTLSGDIPALKDVILTIQTEGADKISFATTIYPNTAAGIAATVDGQIFLVQSADAGSIYNVYQNEAGSAVYTGKRSVSSDALDAAVLESQEASASAIEASDRALTETAKFLAPSNTDPETRFDGSPLQVGDNYLNTGTDPNEYRQYGTAGWFTPNPDAVTLQPQIDALRTDVDSANVDLGNISTEISNISENLQSKADDADIEFTIIYPNGGSAASPAKLAANRQYLEAHPFPGHSVLCVLEILYKGAWCAITTGASGTTYYGGLSGDYNGEFIGIVTAANALAGVLANCIGTSSGAAETWSGANITGSRVRVYKLKGAI